LFQKRWKFWKVIDLSEKKIPLFQLFFEKLMSFWIFSSLIALKLQKSDNLTFDFCLLRHFHFVVYFLNGLGGRKKQVVETFFQCLKFIFLATNELFNAERNDSLYLCPKIRHWTYHFFFDILSYHIICPKNDIISFIS
jgi:hypothetical protein